MYQPRRCCRLFLHAKACQLLLYILVTNWDMLSSYWTAIGCLSFSCLSIITHSQIFALICYLHPKTASAANFACSLNSGTAMDSKSRSINCGPTAQIDLDSPSLPITLLDCATWIPNPLLPGSIVPLLSKLCISLLLLLVTAAVHYRICQLLFYVTSIWDFTPALEKFYGGSQAVKSR